MDCPPVVDGAIRVVLIGDSGLAESEADAVLAAAARCAGEGRVVVLGDLVYGTHRPRLGRFARRNTYGGLGGPDLEPGRAQLAAQLGALSPTDAVFVPGNHDWYAGRRGWVREHDQVEAAGATWSPGDAPCDGAIGHFPLADHAELLVLDSMATLRCKGVAEVYRAALAAGPPPGKWWVVAAHHPAATIGEHAGRGITGQDVDDDGYRRRWTRTLQAIPPDARRNVVIAAGHDHLLALLPDRMGFAMQVVSGTGSARQVPSELRVVRGRSPDLWQDDRWSLSSGFVVLDVAPGSVTATIVRAEGVADHVTLSSQGRD